ncbi:MAG: outer membrane protein transport protein, partial [Bacteroidales bacterium]|nr:outer membrane protein transport protein [Bacteroidales bacterium]
MRIFKLYFLMLAAFICSFAKADNNPSNNNSATQFKTGNRNASTDADAIFYNPAGTVFGEDGFHVEFSVLPFTSSQEIYDAEMDKKYESTTSSLFYPALNLMYKKDKYSIFSNIGITNGGGAGNYDDGLPGFERLGMFNMMTAIQSGAPVPSNNPLDYAYKSSFEGSAYGLGGSLGFAYKITDWLSASVAFQYSYQTNHQEGELSVDFEPADVNISTTEIDVDYTGSNYGFIFGLNLKPVDNLLIAQTFRYYTELELEAKVNDGKDGAGMFVDGEKSLATYVPYYSLGIAYNVSEKLLAQFNMNTTFYSMLDLKTDGMIEDPADAYNNGFDFGLGVEYQVAEKVNYGLGFTYAPTKMKDKYMTEMGFENTSLWLNTGATFNVTEKLDVNVAVQVGLPTEEKTIQTELSEQKYTVNPSY